MSQETISGTLSSYKTDRRVSYTVFLQKAKTHNKEHFDCGDSCLHCESQEESLQTIQSSSSKRVGTFNGRITRIPHTDGSKWPTRLCDGMSFYFRNVHDNMADGKTAYDKRLCVKFDGPLISFGATVSYKPISSKDEARLHQFGKKMLL